MPLRSAEARAPGRRGFTLIELVAALALTGLVFVGAYRLLDQLGDTSVRFAAERTRANQASNGRMLLRMLVFAAQSGADSTELFTGEAGEARFGSWCEAPGGWIERCEVTLTIAGDPDAYIQLSTTSGLSARVSVDSRFASTSSRFVYLDRRGDDPNYDAPAHEAPIWRDRWARSIVAPFALGVVSNASPDTLVLPVGGRS